MIKSSTLIEDTLCGLTELLRADNKEVALSIKQGLSDATNYTYSKDKASIGLLLGTGLQMAPLNIKKRLAFCGRAPASYCLYQYNNCQVNIKDKDRGERSEPLIQSILHINNLTYNTIYMRMQYITLISSDNLLEVTKHTKNDYLS